MAFFNQTHAGQNLRHMAGITQVPAAAAAWISLGLKGRPLHGAGAVQRLLRVRKPPVVASRARPLEGRVIAVDAGHPPIGSTGPTGLYEGDATLMVANALKPYGLVFDLVKLEERQQMVFRPLKAGDTTILVRDLDGDLRLIFKVKVTGSPSFTSFW